MTQSVGHEPRDSLNGNHRRWEMGILFYSPLSTSKSNWQSSIKLCVVAVIVILPEPSCFNCQRGKLILAQRNPAKAGFPFPLNQPQQWNPEPKYNNCLFSKQPSLTCSPNEPLRGFSRQLFPRWVKERFLSVRNASFKVGLKGAKLAKPNFSWQFNSTEDVFVSCTKLLRDASPMDLRSTASCHQL